MTKVTETAPLGIKNIKEVMMFGFATAKMIKAAKEDDGKIDANDLTKLIMIVPTLGPAVSDIDQVLPEFKDLDANEAEELKVMARKELGDVISDEKLVVKIEAALEWSVATVKLVQAL